VDELKLIAEYLKDQGFLVSRRVFHLEVFVPSVSSGREYIGYVHVGVSTKTWLYATTHRDQAIYQMRCFDLHDPSSLPDLVEFLGRAKASTEVLAGQ
jgi:hypothetical protein